ncbi:methyltransferase protein [Salix suchowensis]|nr:methyltransferase protein [Salix suchowensis]
MYSDVSSCNTYNYGDAESFDWYQRYAFFALCSSAYPASSRVLMVGCGNALMSEDMVDDGYENIMNVDISSVAIDLMRRKYEQMPQLKYMEMDVRDMSFFPDESFDAVIDKGTLDSLMCGSDAPISAARMLGEVSRLLKPGGIYMLITYGDPKVRMPHLSRSSYSWKIVLYAIPRPGFKKPAGSSSISHLEPVPITETGSLPADFVLDDPDSHFIYVCKKTGETTGPGNISSYPLIADAV